MSLLLITTEIARFLASKDPEIICIKGRWGVGKTYAWRHLLKEAQTERRIGYDKYSYISLFGRNSLGDLRNSIVENTVGTEDVEAKPTLTSLESATSLLRQGVQKTGFFASLLPQSSGYAQLGQRLLYLLMRNTIVCLDDLERAGAGLNMKDVLGLASQLKDEKGCKVVILLNDERLATDAKSDFHEQMEKVVDVVIDFELSPQEAVDIALDTKTIIYEKLRENCMKLKLDNIRVIKKAERFCSRLLPLLSEFDERLLHQAIHTATLACYSKYQPSKAPDIDFIRSFNLWDGALRTVNGDKSEVDQRYITIQEYGLTAIDGFDEVVLSAVWRGYFDEEQLKAEAKQINDNLLTNDMKNDYHRVWELFRWSFARNEDTLADAMVDAVERNIKIIEPPNLDSVVSALREMGYDDKASALISFFMSHKNEEPARYWDISIFDYHGRVRDPEIISFMAERLSSFEDRVDAVEHLKRVGQRDGWNQRDEAAIAQLTEEEVARIFRTSEGDSLSLIVSAYRTFLMIGNPSPDIIEINRKAKAALKAIAAESKLNAMRARSMFHGIDLDA